MYTKGKGFDIIPGSKYHLGNRGLSEPWCASMRIENFYKAECGAGGMSELKYLGIKPDGDEAMPWPADYCGHLEAWNDINTCSVNHVDFEAAKAKWATDCQGKKNCEFSLNEYVSNDSFEISTSPLDSKTHSCTAETAKVFI